MNQPSLRAFGLSLSLIVGVLAVGCQSEKASKEASLAEKNVAEAKKKLTERAPSGPFNVFIGTYTRANGISKGIYTAKFDPKTGDLSTPQLAAEAKDPSYLAISP